MSDIETDRPDVVENRHIDFLYETSEDERLTRRDLIKALQSEFGLSKGDAKEIYLYWQNQT